MVNDIELKNMLNSNKEEEILKSLLILSMNKIDYDLALKQINLHINSNNNNIKRVAILSLGHVARVYGKMDLNTFLPILKNNLENADKKIAGTSSDVLSDFEIFLKDKF
jgi:HEAT repeat protein